MKLTESSRKRNFRQFRLTVCVCGAALRCCHWTNWMFSFCLMLGLFFEGSFWSTPPGPFLHYKWTWGRKLSSGKGRKGEERGGGRRGKSGNRSHRSFCEDESIFQQLKFHLLHKWCETVSDTHFGTFFLLRFFAQGINLKSAEFRLQIAFNFSLIEITKWIKTESISSLARRRRRKFSQARGETVGRETWSEKSSTSKRKKWISSFWSEKKGKRGENGADGLERIMCSRLQSKLFFFLFNQKKLVKERRKRRTNELNE